MENMMELRRWLEGNGADVRGDSHSMAIVVVDGVLSISWHSYAGTPNPCAVPHRALVANVALMNHHRGFVPIDGASMQLMDAAEIQRLYESLAG